MKAVVNASVTAPAASRGPSVGAPCPAGSRPRQRHPRGATARGRVRPCEGPRCGRPCARRRRRVPSGASRGGPAPATAPPGSLSVSGQPSRPAGGSSARTELKPPWTSARLEAPTPRAVPPSDRPRSPCRCRRDRLCTPSVVARTTKSSASSSSDGSPVPIERSNAPPVRSNRWRAITRHSSVGRADSRALAGRQVVDARDVAVGRGSGSARSRGGRPDRRRPAPPAPRTARRGARRTPRRRWPSPRARNAARRASSRGPAIPSPPSTSGPSARMRKSERGGRRPAPAPGREC